MKETYNCSKIHIYFFFNLLTKLSMGPKKSWTQLYQKNCTMTRLFLMAYLFDNIGEKYKEYQGPFLIRRSKCTLFLISSNFKFKYQTNSNPAHIEIGLAVLVRLGALFCIDSRTICQRIFYRGDKKQLFLKNKSLQSSLLLPLTKFTQ